MKDAKDKKEVHAAHGEVHAKPIMVEEDIETTIKRAELEKVKAETSLINAQKEDILNKAMPLTDAEILILTKLKALSRLFPATVGIAINGSDFDSTLTWEDIHALVK